MEDRGRDRSLIVTHPGDEVLENLEERHGVEEKARPEAQAGAPTSTPP